MVEKGTLTSRFEETAVFCCNEKVFNTDNYFMENSASL